MTCFLFAHAVELIERFSQAARYDGLEPLDFLSDGGGRWTDYTRQTQNRPKVRFCLNVKLLSKRPGGFEVGRCDLAVHPHGLRAGKFVINRDVEMATTDSLANDLADVRFDRLETVRHAEMQIEETMVDAAN